MYKRKHVITKNGGKISAKVAEVVKTYGQYLIDNAENIVGNIEETLTKKIEIAFTLNADGIPDIIVKKELVPDRMTQKAVLEWNDSRTFEEEENDSNE